MKLIRLKINDPKGFRSLRQGFETYFLRDWDYEEVDQFNPYVLVGPNGSGKSNVLEALAAIFYHIECVHLDYRPDQFGYDEEENPTGFQSKIATPDAFELEYFIPVPGQFSQNQVEKAHIKIVKEVDASPKVYWINRDPDCHEEDLKPLNKAEVKSLLPEYILGYSSGENEILSLPFFKTRFIHFDEYRDFLIRDTPYHLSPEGRMIYLDQSLSQAVLLSNFLLSEPETLRPFAEELGIEGVKTFQIVIRNHQSLELHPDRLRDLSPQEREQEAFTRRRLIANLKTILDKLEQCTAFPVIGKGTDTLTFHFIVQDATREAFKDHFGSAIKLFQAFQVLFTLNLYSVEETSKKQLYESNSLYVKETIPTLPAEKRVMYFNNFLLKKRGVADGVSSKSLSDGEHQFLQSIGLCLLFRDENSLFLLDEPETHFNPDWRAKFITGLRACFEVGKAAETMREMLITCHTPYMVSDSREEYVLIFDKDQNSNRISVTRPSFKTLGASIDQITTEIFGKKETIGGYAERVLNEMREKFEKGADPQSIIQETNKKLGDSVEKLFFLKEVLQKMKER